MGQKEPSYQEGNWCCITTSVLLVMLTNIGIIAAVRIALEMEDDIHEPLIQGERRNHLYVFLYLFSTTFFFGCWCCMCCACRPWAAKCPGSTSSYITIISHKFISKHPRLRRTLSIESEMEIDEIVVGHHEPPPLRAQSSDNYPYENPKLARQIANDRIMPMEAMPHIVSPPAKMQLGRLRSMSIDVGSK